MAQARSIFDESFLSIRAKLIEVAAALDRIDRAAIAQDDGAEASDVDAGLEGDPRRGRVEEALALLRRGGTAPGERAAAIQQLFSRQYEPDWRKRFGL